MKSLRLNKEMRDNILSNFVAKYLVANPKPTITRSIDMLKSDIATKISNNLYGKYVELVPKDLLNTCNYLCVQLPNDSVAQFYFRVEGGDCISLPSTKENKVEYVFTESDPMWIEYQVAAAKLKEENAVVEAHEKALSKFKGEVKQVLESVNTTLQLVEVWPEAAPFVPQEISNPSSINLPSVNFAELNKVIG